MATPTGVTQTYPSSSSWWPSEGFLTVRDTSDQLLLLLPIQFMRLGLVLSFDYVLEQCRHAFEGEGVLRTPDGNEVHTDEAVTAGSVVILDTGTSGPCRPRRGPRFKYKHRAPTGLSETSTMSNSKRSTTNQANFRDSLLARDGRCVISGVVYGDCTACHILPQSRPEYYEEVLGYPELHPFLPSYGLLLQDSLHHAFDRGQIALYPLGEDLVVHVFRTTNPDHRQYHGKVIPPSYFRSYPEDFPNRALLHFHYQQCAIQNIRGYAFGMSPPTT